MRKEKKTSSSIFIPIHEKGDKPHRPLLSSFMRKEKKTYNIIPIQMKGVTTSSFIVIPINEKGDKTSSSIVIPIHEKRDKTSSSIFSPIHEKGDKNLSLMLSRFMRKETNPVI
ncbi:hypothetical protein ACJMK2_016962 [Sinanodonta woodiana]|uniref:Uncharacterized protein n=1 Tax=Sinanodonta woodiana TaxID=1069815 RepID=A0ABD3UVE1_SINWO